MFELEALNRSLARAGLPGDPDLFAQLEGHYSGADRHYHGAPHIADCLAQLAEHRSSAEDLASLEMAVWFHDVIYDTTKQDNEEQSAALATQYLTGAGAERELVSSVSDLIVATKTHVSFSDDCSLLLDIDLSILGAPPEAFESYDQAIRREFHWVPDETYRAARANVLQSFLERERIYQTKDFRDRLEERARDNLRRKLSDLRETAG